MRVFDQQKIHTTSIILLITFSRFFTFFLIIPILHISTATVFISFCLFPSSFIIFLFISIISIQAASFTPFQFVKKQVLVDDDGRWLLLAVELIVFGVLIGATAFLVSIVIVLLTIIISCAALRGLVFNKWLFAAKFIRRVILFSSQLFFSLHFGQLAGTLPIDGFEALLFAFV